MKDLNNIVVFIKDEAMLEKARRVLVENGEGIGDEYFSIKYGNYLFRGRIWMNWMLSGYKFDYEAEITLTELENRLKERK